MKNKKSLLFITGILWCLTIGTPAVAIADTGPPQNAQADTLEPDADSGQTDPNLEQVLELINEERKNNGVPPLTSDASLLSSADTRAKEIADEFEHTRPDGREWYTVLDDSSIIFSTAGENIAYGQRTPETVVTDWMNSPPHRENILNSEFTKLGVGLFIQDDTYYWTQLFISD